LLGAAEVSNLTYFACKPKCPTRTKGFVVPNRNTASRIIEFCEAVMGEQKSPA
jgi:hypothetical protein